MIRIVFLTLMLFVSHTKGDQEIQLKAGGSVAIAKMADVTVVSCEGQSSNVKCLCVYSESLNRFEIRYYPNDVSLGYFIFGRPECLRALSEMAECR